VLEAEGCAKMTDSRYIFQLRPPIRSRKKLIRMCIAQERCGLQ